MESEDTSPVATSPRNASQYDASIHVRRVIATPCGALSDQEQKLLFPNTDQSVIFALEERLSALEHNHKLLSTDMVQMNSSVKALNSNYTGRGSDTTANIGVYDGEWIQGSYVSVG